jgi:hypothetical protein
MSQGLHSKIVIIAASKRVLKKVRPTQYVLEGDESNKGLSGFRT